MADRRWSMTSSERHGMIALAILLMILTVVAALTEGILSPSVVTVGSVAEAPADSSAAEATLIQHMDETAADTTAENRDTEHKHNRHKSRRKTGKNSGNTKRPAPRSGTSRNHLDEAADR